MKKLINYLSKKSLSLGNGSGMARKRLGNDSGMTRFSLASLICLCILTVGVGNVWGKTVSVVAGTYNKQANVEVTGNGSYIFMFGTSSDAYVMQNATSGSNYLGRSSQFTSLPSSITITTSPATNTSYFWSVTDYDSKTGTFKLCGPNGYCYCSASGKLKADQDNSSTWHIGTTSGVIYMIDGNSCYVKNTGTSGFRAYSTTDNRTQLVAVYKLAPSCTPLTMSSVTAVPASGQIALSWSAVSNADSYTVSCKVKSTGVAAGTGTGSGKTGTSCTITGLTNDTEYTWSVEPVGSGSYCSSNTPATGDAIPGTYYTVTWKASGSSDVTTSVRSGTKPTFPDTPTSCDGTSTTFYGWAAAGSTWSGKTDDISDKTIYTSASAMPNVTGAVTYHAVFAKATGSGTTTQAATISTTNPYISGTGWDINISGTYTYSGPYLRLDADGEYVVFTSPKGAISRFQFTYKLNSSTTCTGHSGTAWWIGDVKFYVSSDGGSNWSELSTKSINDINTGTGLGSDVAKDYDDLSSGGYNAIKVQLSKSCGNLGIKGLSATYANVTYSEYLTSCCTPLGSVTGILGTNTPTSVTLTWSAVSGAEKYQVKVPGSSSHNDWTDAVSGVSVTKSCGTAYTAYFRAIDTNGSHCSEGPESTLAIPAVSWTVTSTGVTHATASPTIPSTTCSGFSTTISPATGYALPAEITVTNASKLWNSSTGALTISSVTGNVSITITPTCVSPVISGDPADASYYVGDSPDALSVSATLASGTRTYLWKVSTNGGSTWSDAAGTNNAATYSGASLSTASAGTLKFKCIVGNSEGGCTVESGVATITVNAASSWKLKGSWDSWEEHTMIEDAGVASYSISLDADSRFNFCIDDNGTAYKNNGTMITTTSGWVFNTSDGNCNIHTGPAGTYTFAINTTTKAVTVTYPDVTHPNEHYVYFKNTNVWTNVYGYLGNTGNSNKAAPWPGSDMKATTTICGETYHYAALNAMSGTYNVINFNDGGSGYGHQTSDLSTTGSLGKYNANQDASWHQFKYAINFDKGTGSGDAMVSIENLCPGSNQALTANTYTKEHHTFAGWIADVDVKVGESTIDAGKIIDDEVTIKDIQSDINLTAQWTPNTYTITKTLTNVANAGLPASFTYTGATTTALNSTFTVDATNFFLPSNIAVTMGGTPLTAGTHYTYNNSTGAFTFSAVITGNIVITATATAKLKSIAITTQPTTRKYFAGESFSSTGAVVTATMGDGSTKTVSATWTPSGALSAGTGQTVTASYTENAIDMTATTTIDVYSVTVNKVNEDGDAVSADGVTAGWTVGTKALAASATSASKYVFKEWQVTGATAASTSSANTTLSSPTANVVVNAVFWKPRTVKWSVNGNDSYNTGSPTTTVAYNGTISTVPTDPSGLACAGTFVAWTDAAHNNGTTAKDDDSYYGAALYSAAGDFPSITAATTTFYAVFAEKTNSDGYKYIGDDGTLTDGKKYIFVNAKSAGSAYALKATDLAAPNSGNNGTAVSVTVTSNAEGVLVTTINTALEFEYVSSGTKLKYEVDGPATRYLFINGDGVGMKSDDSRSRYTTDAGLQGWNNKVTTYYDVYYNSTNEKFEKKESAGSRVYAFIKQTATYGNYVTECDPNIVSVTYDANGGATSCANTTTDKTEDYTVCSSAPTRDYYTFAGWLCSADSKTYAANATISAAAIDADFTLTAQWTPVPYSITYNYNGGSAQVDPAPATSYTVESSEITLQTPTKGHDRFDGWYENADLSTGGVKTTIAAGSHENKTYYAKWTARHEIIFDADGATTTIYRADDEDLSASVAEQGSVPSDPSAPTACSSKVFVGWSESTIDDETDDEPADLMKPAAGTVNADKHYYAVWATQASTSGPVTVFEDALYGKAANNTTFDTYGDWDSFGYVYGCGTSTAGVRVSSQDYGGHLQLKANIGLASVDTIKFKIKSYGDTNGGKITLSSYSGAGTYDNGSSAVFTTTNTSSWEEKTCILRSADNTTDIRFEGSGSKYRVYLKDIIITKAGTVYTYSAYSTSCCATKVTLSENSPEHGTIVFGKTSVGTCGGDKEVSLTITPAAGYQLATYSVATGDGKVATKNDPGIELNNNSSAAQNITLTFAEDANGAYAVTASFTEMVASAWTWTKHVGGATITTDPVEVYVGQKVQVDVSYEPAGLLSNHTNNSAYDYPKPWSNPNVGSPAKAGDHFTVTGTNAGSTSITLTHNDGLTKTIYYTVVARPLVHFVDKIHDETFADVVAAVSGDGWTVTTTLPTPTHSDVSDPGSSYNTCERQHLHLVGWILSTWADAHPGATHEQIVGANVSNGAGTFLEAGADFNVETYNGNTYYAVWSQVE